MIREVFIPKTRFLYETVGPNSLIFREYSILRENLYTLRRTKNFAVNPYVYSMSTQDLLNLYPSNMIKQDATGFYIELPLESGTKILITPNKYNRSTIKITRKNNPKCIFASQSSYTVDNDELRIIVKPA